MTELRICRPAIFHFRFKTYDVSSCITKWTVNDQNALLSQFKNDNLVYFISYVMISIIKNRIWKIENYI